MQEHRHSASCLLQTWCTSAAGRRGLAEPRRHLALYHTPTHTDLYTLLHTISVSARRRPAEHCEEQPRDISRATALLHTQAQVLTSWGISSCTLEDAFIKIAQQSAEDVRSPRSTAGVVTGLMARQGRCLQGLQKPDCC